MHACNYDAFVVFSFFSSQYLGSFSSSPLKRISPEKFGSRTERKDQIITQHNVADCFFLHTPKDSPVSEFWGFCIDWLGISKNLVGKTNLKFQEA